MCLFWWIGGEDSQYTCDTVLGIVVHDQPAGHPHHTITTLTTHLYITITTPVTTTISYLGRESGLGGHGWCVLAVGVIVC